MEVSQNKLTDFLALIQRYWVAVGEFGDNLAGVPGEGEGAVVVAGVVLGQPHRAGVEVVAEEELGRPVGQAADVYPEVVVYVVGGDGGVAYCSVEAIPAQTHSILAIPVHTLRTALEFVGRIAPPTNPTLQLTPGPIPLIPPIAHTSTIGFGAHPMPMTPTINLAFRSFPPLKTRAIFIAHTKPLIAALCGTHCDSAIRTLIPCIAHTREIPFIVDD